MLSLCLHFEEFQPIYAYKGYAYKNKQIVQIENTRQKFAHFWSTKSQVKLLQESHMLKAKLKFRLKEIKNKIVVYKTQQCIILVLKTTAMASIFLHKS